MPPITRAKFSIAPLAAVLAVLLAPSLAAQVKPDTVSTTGPTTGPTKKYLVRFSFKTGATVRTVLQQETRVTMNIGAQDMVTNILMTIWTSTTVKSTEGNTANLEQVITRAKAFSDGITMKVDYDSDDEDSDPRSLQSLADIVGQKTTMKLTDTGKVSDVVMPNSVNDLKGAGFDIEQMMSQSLTQLPDHPIAIGETWKVQKTPPLAALMEAKAGTKTEMLYKLLAVDGDSITVQQSLHLDTDALQRLPGGIKANNIKVSGTSKIDLRTGTPTQTDLTISSDFGENITMKVHVRQSVKLAPPQRKKGQSAPAAGSGK